MCALQDSPQPESENQLLEVLADSKRRHVLAVLESRDERLTRDDLASEVAAHDSGESSAETVDDVEVMLHHVHLPKLEQAGLVEYDADSGIVTYHGPPEIAGSGVISDFWDSI